MGRAIDPRSVILNFRVTSAERDSITRAAKREGIKRGEFMRARVLGQNLPRRRKPARSKHGSAPMIDKDGPIPNPPHVPPSKASRRSPEQVTAKVLGMPQEAGESVSGPAVTHREVSEFADRIGELRGEGFSQRQAEVIARSEWKTMGDDS